MSKAASPVPAGFHGISVHLTVNGAARYADFLKQAFNAVETHRSAGPGGKLMNVQMRIGDSTIMFNDNFCAEFNLPPVAEGNLPFLIQLYVPDADATWAQAVNAGCTVTMPLADQFWGDR